MSGDFAWKDPTVAPAVSDSQKTEYDVVFTPKDENYDKAECKVKLTVNKTAATVTKAPEAKALTYTGSAQELVTAGEATGGTMQYALGTATEATKPYTTSIPTATNAGTYLVWHRRIVKAASLNSLQVKPGLHEMVEVKERSVLAGYPKGQRPFGAVCIRPADGTRPADSFRV